MKKAEITSQQIVLLIILLVSFIIILFFLFRLNLGKQSDNEICHNSVTMRGSSVIPTSAVPLKCSREYVCITKDGSCERMTKPEIIKVKTKEEIYYALAEKMADCWWMFGEGKINYVTNTMTKDNYCSICSQLAFDDSLNEIEGIEGKISKDEFYDYLSKTQMPNGDFTYLYYFLKTNDIESVKRDLSSQANGEVSFGEINLGEQYFIVMGITSNVNTLGWVIRGAAGGAVGAVLVASGSFSVVAIGTVIGATAGGVSAETISDIFSPKIGAITVDGDGIKNKFMIPTIQQANSEEFKLLNCEEVITST